MAEALVAGAFLSTVLQVAFERLASREVLDFFRGRNLKEGLLKKLRIVLISVNQVVEDAEERQYRNPNVKQWLDELKDEVFKAEDLLDEIATEASRQKLDAESKTVTSKVRGFFTTFANQTLSNKKIELRITEVLGILEHLIKQNEILGLRGGPTVVGTQLGMTRKVLKRLPTTSVIDESNIYGRDADKENKWEHLISPNMSENQLPLNMIVAIVGMGGLGKTTLARLIYEDERIKEQFQHRAWVCISEEFDVEKAMKTILEELESFRPKQEELESETKKAEAPDGGKEKPTDDKLNEKLMGKKIFLVLDDVWNENRQIWKAFQAPFKHVAIESKILVTTRNRNVAEVMHCTNIYDLKPLADENCWKLFAKHALMDQHHVADPKLEEIGREIVRKCGGLPLALKTLGSLLYTKQSHQNWKKISNSSIWDFSENDSNIIPSLRLSYHYLPSNLKRCFAYCSIFPKDYVIDKNILIQLWMAEGLLHSNSSRDSIEEVGDEFFNDLVSRSFFEPSKQGGDYFIMHDLLNDLAKSVTGEFCLWPEFDRGQKMSTRARYFSCLYYDASSFKDISMCSSQARTLFEVDTKLLHADRKGSLTRLKCLRALSLKKERVAIKLNNDIYNSRHLRYLDLSYTSIEKLPNSLCSMINLQTLKLKACNIRTKLPSKLHKLINLRYLDLSCTLIKKLPNSLCSMINLHTLKLYSCIRLTKLPSELHKLINLRHLDLEKSGIKRMPKYLSKLEHLHIMSKFAVEENKKSGLKELGALKYLKGTLVIVNLEYINDPENAREANLTGKHLDKLALEWRGFGGGEASREKEEEILEALEPDGGVLKELTIKGYGGSRFPIWFRGSHLTNLASLYLEGCRNCDKLPRLGQLPHLERLVIKKFHGVKEIGQEFYGHGSSTDAFKSLLYLEFGDMKGWEEWDICYEGKSFQRLRELRMKWCGRLTKSLPQNLPCLKVLEIGECRNLETKLPKSSAMEKLHLKGCKKISVKDMPTWRSVDVVPPLHELELEDCAEMESLPRRLLSDLQRLSIRRCPKLIASGKECGMHETLSLEHLAIINVDAESFPEEGLLPSNLHSHLNITPN